MDFSLSEEQLMYQDMVRKFAQNEIKPVAMEFDQKSDPEAAVPLELTRKGFEQGFHQMIVPTDMGGTGLDALTSLVILEELAAGDAGYATTWHVNNVTLTTLLNLGGAEHGVPFVRQIVDGEGGLAALSTTEPDGGVTSALLIDPMNFVFKTTAHMEGDQWVINGAKSYCSNGGMPLSKWILVFCRVDMEKKGWASTLPIVVPVNAPGVVLHKEEDKMGQRLSNTQSLTLDNVRVPSENAIGAGGRGISGGKRVVTYEHDSAIAAISIGCARTAYEEAVAWAKQREVLGQPIIQYQMIQSKIADMFIGLEAARAFAWRVANYSDTHNEMDVKLSRAVKVFASETANRVTDTALQVLGGVGYCKGTFTEKHYRDQRVTTIYEGTNESQRISISRMIEAGI